MRLILAIIISLSTLLNMGMASESAGYHILKGKLHSGGVAKVEILQESAQVFSVKMDYEIYKKILVPIPDHALKGDTVVDLPPQFATEVGYLELETKGSMEIERATLKFMGRTKWKQHNDAYKILIMPKNGKSKIEVTYHPSIIAAGWGRILITFINPLPVLNGYQAQIEIN